MSDRVAHEPGEMHPAAGSRISLTERFIGNVVPSLRCWHLDDMPLAACTIARHIAILPQRGLGIRMLTFCPIASRSARPNGRSAAVSRNCIFCEFARERFELHERHNEEERSCSAAETRVPIVHRAVSTSGGYGFCSDQEERINRLLLVRASMLHASTSKMLRERS